MNIATTSTQQQQHMTAKKITLTQFMICGPQTDSETFKTRGRRQLLWKHLELRVQKGISVFLAGT